MVVAVPGLLQARYSQTELDASVANAEGDAVPA
jgi:hypothetical protein